jgi:hypothetical protein
VSATITAKIDLIDIRNRPAHLSGAVMVTSDDAAKAAPNAAKKVRGKPFVKGKSGNPKGMRRGTRHRMTVLAEQLMSDDVEAVVAKVVKKAKGGDMSAARLILDRIVPVRRGRAVRFPLPTVKTPGDVVAALAAVTAAVGRGEISSDEALQLATVIEVAHRAIKTVEHETRLAAIEEMMGLKNEQ